MDHTGFRRNSTGRWIRIGTLAAACSTLGACSSMPKFFSNETTTGTPAPQQTVDRGLGRDVMTSNDDKKNVVSVVSQSKYGYIRIERAEAAGQGPNDHPVRLTAEQIRSMLGKLQIRQGGKDTEPIFTEDELKELSIPLAEAFAKAGPREDVTFAVSGRHGGVLGSFAPYTVTGGRAFYKSGMLNVIFGEIHGEFESQFLATGWMRQFVTGSRSRKGAGDWTVTSGEPLQYADAGRPDWIKLGEAAVAPAVGAIPAPAATPAGKASASSGTGGPASPASSAPVVAPNRDAFYQDMEKRLSVLKGLRDKGLITEEEYNEKRKAILKEL